MIETSALLKGYTFIDLSLRLPGPLASNLLSQLGASIIKVEDLNYGDPFEKGLPGVRDESFRNWYSNLNTPKEIIKLDFKDYDDQKTLLNKISHSQGLILGPPQKILDKLGVTPSFLESVPAPFVCLKMLGASDQKTPLHDLNALARTGQLKAHIHGKKEVRLSPPFLPVAGVTFGLRASLELVATLLKSEKDSRPLYHEINLLDSSCGLFDLFHTKNPGEEEFSYLHNGRFPCYQIYQTKDCKYMALAAVEEKYWSKFTKIYDLPLKMEDRFDESEKTFQVLINFFQSKNISEIMEILGEHQICLDPV